MNTDAMLQRARLLIAQHRAPQAIEILHQVLLHDPDHHESHVLLACCLMVDRDRLGDATREAEKAIHLAPDQPSSHYVFALVMQKRGKVPEAIAAVNEALALNPEDADYHALKAQLLMEQSRWAEALQSTETGLACDPENEDCRSLRSFALERLGRSGDAIAEAERAVQRSPDSASAHASRGWALLHSHRYQESQEAFREALRLDPSNEFARDGMLQALNHNYLVYRLVYRFHTFASRMSNSGQWLLILGMFFGMRALRSLANQYPALAPFVTPIAIFYILFCILSWINVPLFNTFLRFHPFGKFLLSTKEKWASNVIATLLFIGVASALVAILKGDYASALINALLPVVLTMPVAFAFSIDEGWPKMVAWLFAIGLSLLYFGFLLFDLLGLSVAGGFLGMFALGIVVFTFAGNFLRGVRVER